MATANLDLATLAENQANKYLTINSSLNAIDAALTEVASHAIDSGDVFNMTAAQFRAAIHFTFTNGGIDAAGTVNVPAIKRGFFHVYNNTGQTLTIQKTGGQSVTAPTLANGSRAAYTMDGSNVFAI